MREALLPLPMNFDLSAEQKLLRDEARRFLSEAAGFDRIRAHLATHAAFDRALWRRVAELGWMGVAIPESHGGLGLGPLELCVLLEELGRSLAPLPFFSTVALGARVLQRAGGPQAGLLRDIAAGECVVAVAGWEASGGVSPSRVTGETLQRDPSPARREIGVTWDGASATGTLRPVADLMGADRIVVAARDPSDELFLLLVSVDAEGLQRRAIDGICPLRPHGALELRKCAAIVLAHGADARRCLETLADEAAVMTAFEQVGGAEAALTMARDHAVQRFAFGRPIGGNQAVKHKLADVLVAIELARSNAWFGAWAMGQGGGGLPRAAAAARIAATDAFEMAAQENLHLHGGIGYTWEANAHFYVRRARLLATSAGNVDCWSRRLLAPAA